MGALNKSKGPKALLSRLLLASWLLCPLTPRRKSRPPPSAALLSSPRPSQLGARSDLRGSGGPSDPGKPLAGEEGQPSSPGKAPSLPGTALHGSRDPSKASGCGVPGCERSDRGSRPVPGESLSPRLRPSEKRRGPGPRRDGPPHLRRGGGCPGSSLSASRTRRSEAADPAIRRRPIGRRKGTPDSRDPRRRAGASAVPPP